jgi:hypothetical protein
MPPDPASHPRESLPGFQKTARPMRPSESRTGFDLGVGEPHLSRRIRPTLWRIRPYFCLIRPFLGSRACGAFTVHLKP